MKLAIKKAGIHPKDIDILNSHATATPMGDIQECKAIKRVFDDCDNVYVNNTKSYIGHAMGAAGALELAGNIPSLDDSMVHPTINIDNLDEECKINNIVINKPLQLDKIKYILNNSFGMYGINSVVIIKKYEE
jgi:3-oxoacyl-[acyl-carrier-protein] synthase II